MRWMRSPCLTIAVLPIAACMTWTQIPIHRIPTEIGPGDTVKLETLGGVQHRFAVSKVESRALVGGEERVEYREILWLKKRQFDAGRTWRNIGYGAAVVGGVLLVAVIVGAIYVSQKGGVMG